ncbi:hypothetical protein GQ457_07G003770 [Hibiscus cannabinus]
MYHDSNSPENYVSEWYSKKKYMASYKHILQPVRGEIFWPKNLLKSRSNLRGLKGKERKIRMSPQFFLESTQR